ncbi:transcription factor MYB27-like [Macadamia integrifolia]|uniref:transcription factor MYB27-like n=1 Tax=Macadamia integrifolia TaxID=60698 RepID=UPI001C4E7D79|nr:transcription factor MYB27-like [Macadamia integrifolia]
MMAYKSTTQDETLRKGAWLEEEDELLVTFVTIFGQRRWDSIAKASGLRRSGKSCRLRWLNYLRPDLKHGRISAEEERIILHLHQRWGNKWSKIARKLPGRTDNEVKNYWRSHLRKTTLAQEQENLQKEIRIVAPTPQDFLTQEGDQITKTWSFEDDSSVMENKLGMSEDSTDIFTLSDNAFASSPYETHLTDWISGISDNQTVMIHGEEGSILDPLFCYPTWISENETDVSAHCFDSLWDVDYKNLKNEM